MVITTRSLGSIAAVLIGISSFIAACSDENSATTTTAATSSVSSGSGAGGEGTGGGGTGGGGAGGGGGSCVNDATFVAHFDATKGELAEGLYVEGTTAYVGFAGNGKLVKVDLTSNAVSPFGSIDTFPAMGAFLLGVARDQAGNVYVGAQSSDPAAFMPGIYKMPAAGGAAPLFASNAGLTFPNGLVFDMKGDLYVTDSGSGAIFQVPPSGLNVTEWLKDPLLAPDPASACKSGIGIGANGIVISNGAFYVANTDNASIIKIPIMPNGSPGAASLLAGPDCATLAGADGLTVDQDGSLIVALNGKNEIARVGMDGKITTMFAGCPLDSPASVAIGMINGGRELFITNAAFAGNPPMPGLLSLPLK
jgi:sugar lactone lactonase YvrE